MSASIIDRSEPISSKSTGLRDSSRSHARCSTLSNAPASSHEVGHLVENHDTRLILRQDAGELPQCRRPIPGRRLDEQFRVGQRRNRHVPRELSQRVVAEPDLRGVEDVRDPTASDELFNQRRLADPAPSPQDQAPPGPRRTCGGSHLAEDAPQGGELTSRILSPTILSVAIACAHSRRYAPCLRSPDPGAKGSALRVAAVRRCHRVRLNRRPARSTPMTRSFSSRLK